MFTPKFPACAIHHGACLPICAGPPSGLIRAGGKTTLVDGSLAALSAARGTAAATPGGLVPPTAMAAATRPAPAQRRTVRRLTGLPHPAAGARPGMFARPESA
jgi:hypothetical protein